MEYYNLLKTERKSKEMTLAILSEKTGISVSYLSKLENQTEGTKLTPSFEQIVSLAKALDLNIEELAVALDKNYKPQETRSKSPKAEKVKKIIQLQEEYFKPSQTDNFLGRVMKVMKLLKDNVFTIAIMPNHDDYDDYDDHKARLTSEISVIELPFYDDKIVDYLTSLLESERRTFLKIDGVIKECNNYIDFDNIKEKLDIDDFYIDEDEFDQVKTRYSVLYKDFIDLMRQSDFFIQF